MLRADIGTPPITPVMPTPTPLPSSLPFPLSPFSSSVHCCCCCSCGGAGGGVGSFCGGAAVIVLLVDDDCNLFLALTTLSDSSLTIFSILALSPATVSISPHTHRPYVTGSPSPSSPAFPFSILVPHLVLLLRITNFSLVSISSGLVIGIIKFSRPRRERMMSWNSSWLE